VNSQDDISEMRRAKLRLSQSAKKRSLSAEHSVCAARLHVYTTPAFYRWRESDCRAVRFQTTNYTTTSTTVPTWNGFRYDSRSRPISFLASQKHVCKDESVILTKTFFFVRILTPRTVLLEIFLMMTANNLRTVRVLINTIVNQVVGKRRNIRLSKFPFE